MVKSSFHIQIASIFALFHAAREAIVTYLIDNPSRNVVDRDGDKSHEYYLALLMEVIANYTQRTGQKIQTNKKKFIWEAVVNLNEEHTLKDLKLLARVLRMMFGWQAIQLSIHNDEGHIDTETSEKIYNIHGHMVFLMLNKNGIYAFKKRDFGVKKMEELQTLVARVLKMERGISKKITKRERLNHRQYRYVAKIKERMQNVINELKSDVSDLKMEIFSLIADLAEYENIDVEHALYKEQNQKLKEESQKRIKELVRLVYSDKWKNFNEEGNEVKAKNISVVMYLEKKEEELKKFSDAQGIKISNLEEWKRNILDDIYNLRNSEVLLNESKFLNKYISSKNADKVVSNQSELLSFEDEEYCPEHDYVFGSYKSMGLD